MNGGLDLAAKMTGFETEAFCEIEKYPTELLKLRFPGKKIIKDVRDIDGREFRGIDLISGGFPCQPFSVAGKRKGEFDERHLFPEMARIISEAKPEWVVGENVSGLFSICNEAGTKGGVFGDCISRLSQMGYSVGWCCFGACDVGAPHKRERVFLIANQDAEKVKKVICKVYESLQEYSVTAVKNWNTPIKQMATDAGFPPSCANRDSITGDIRRLLWATPTSGQRGGIRNDFQKPLNIQAAEIINDKNLVRYKGDYILSKAKLNPDWVALLMGFPVGWASLGECEDYFRGWPMGYGYDQYDFEPPRIIDKCDSLAKQLKGYGNAVVPYQALPIFQAIKEAQNETT